MGREGKAERDAAFVTFVEQATPSLMRTAWHRVRRDEAVAYARQVRVDHNTDTWRRQRGERLVADLPEPLLRSITFTGPDGRQHRHSYRAGSKG